MGQQRYHPYGTGRPTDTNLPTDYRFTGQRREGTIGLYDYGARFYDPLLGRFVSADTVVPQPGHPQALNRYSNCHNNPLKYVDPDGHFPLIPVLVVAVLAVGGLAVTTYAYNEGYLDSGFQIQPGFNAHEIQVLGQTIRAFESRVGGPEQFQKLMRASENGFPVPVWKDTTQAGADAGIRLGTTAFDVQLARNSNYSDWGAADDDTFAQNVFGHEIGHRLIGVGRSKGVDAAEEYKRRVPPNGIPAWNNTGDAEQEAVTNLSLIAQGREYTWATFAEKEDLPDSMRTALINEWAKWFFDLLKQY